VRLADLTGRRVALLGLGADVRAALGPVLAAGPASVVAVESGPLPRGAEVPIVSLADAAASADVLVRSPGFPRYQPPLVDALARGAAMTTPLDLWMGTVGPGRTVVAITGTKGKSTATDLVGALAARAGIRVGLAGNLGVPVFDHGWDHEAPVVVLEVSSYQAADLHHVPDVAVLTFLAEDHLSWHGGVERYTADKLRALRNEGGTAGLVLIPSAGGRAASELHAAGIPHQIVTPPDAPPEVPVHRVQNAALAAAVLVAVGGPVLTGPEVVEAARSSLPGRLDACPAPGGLLAIDDALASNPSATAAGLAWLRGLHRPTVVILGGAERGVDPAPLVQEVSQWPESRLRAVTLPDNGPLLAATAGIEVLAAVDDVEAAVRLAVAGLPADGVVVFSPAAPTRPGEGNWEDRSAAFRRALAALA
jgi:UDP-N-acetylmuramoylalanine-D-glutamate ligase